MFSVPFACVFVRNSHDQTRIFFRRKQRIGADSIVFVFVFVFAFVFVGVACGKTDLRVPYKISRTIRYLWKC